MQEFLVRVCVRNAKMPANIDAEGPVSLCCVKVLLCRRAVTHRFSAAARPTTDAKNIVFGEIKRQSYGSIQ